MTELRRRRPPRHKTGGSRNGYTKGLGSSQSGKDSFVVMGIPLQQLIINGLGILVCLYIGYKHALYMRTIHENHMWFTNIKEVEREISFRTESGLYYSYYKQLVHASSITQGLYEITHDNMTEHPSTINVLERMNIYQEVILSILYRVLPIKVSPQHPLQPHQSKSSAPSTASSKHIKASPQHPLQSFSYLSKSSAPSAVINKNPSDQNKSSAFPTKSFSSNKVFIILYRILLIKVSPQHPLQIPFFQSRSIAPSTKFSTSKLDTTRVEYIIPLRESFSLPFLWVQIAATSFYFRPSNNPTKDKLSIALSLVSTFFFALGWQFNQFIILLQSFSLFGVWILDLVPPKKVKMMFYIEAISLLAVCLLQFINKMILGSFVMSFIPAALFLMYIKGDDMKLCSIPSRIFKVISYSTVVLMLMVSINLSVKVLINVEADEHIYKFVLSKFGIGNPRDFDSRIYLCLEAFNFLSFDTYERLTKGMVFPFYVATHAVLLIVLCVAVLQNWSNHVHDSTVKDTASTKKSHLLSNRPELAYHIVQTVFFGVLAMSTLRMKYLWTPYMCILASFGISDYRMWRTVLAHLKTQGMMVQIVRHLATLIVLAALLAIALPPVFKELEELKEFWDPDTVQLMEWIKKETPKKAAFTGSMQLLAGVKLCTGRPITNHPHYEDKQLRDKTKDLYQIYARKTPEDVHKLLKKHKANYIILEDSICLAPSRNGCRTPDLMDFHNGHLPDASNGKMEPGLVRSKVARFCDEIRYNGTRFLKLFKPVLSNKTFRVHKVV
ncbi:probable C-mannosyltransferase DPY19L3 [Mizuhopecten yessoensis]|uniref:probable C-mannosyltransferase DPY19L3 n=1 Tax=Mizuhopecten yessoensis TaxID=6573 RepID=UPI000B45D4C2|nr:probable C-mannosyltransferase DPY19L3 [Mizuhopecten yessoensis]